MYQEKLKPFENVENLAGKSWEHAVAIDVLNNTNIKDCAIHCFHYQQMLELFFKHLLETKSEFGSYSKTHKLQRLLEEVIANTQFRTDKSKYFMALQVITVCAASSPHGLAHGAGNGCGKLLCGLGLDDMKNYSLSFKSKAAELMQ
jgi:hypothetical protein